jgi:hypothetical protein
MQTNSSGTEDPIGPSEARTWFTPGRGNDSPGALPVREDPGSGAILGLHVEGIPIDFHPRG